ncbi:MAG: STAS domain-containing protein [Verrucomicrobia bacterium]|nr:STAS domain-containing protein [Verrucomicrobiota bacterium]
MNNNEGEILVSCFDNVDWIRVEGKGSHLNSSQIKEFTQRSLEKGHRNFVVDLENCPAVDSTFMGTLASMALKLRYEPDGRVDVINATGRTRDAMTSLGLHCLLEMDEDGSAWKSERELVEKNLGKPLASDDEVSKKEKTGNVLAAHEALVEANSENFSRFKDVINYLKDDLNDDEST